MTPAMDVNCPRCGAVAGHPCTDCDGTALADPHGLRRHAGRIEHNHEHLYDTIRRVAERCAERAHYVAGTDVRSPHYRESMTWKAAAAGAARKRAARGAQRVAPGVVKAHRRARRARASVLLWRANPAAAAARTLILRPVRTLTTTLLTLGLVAWLVWTVAVPAPLKGPLRALGGLVIPSAYCGPQEEPVGGATSIGWQAGHAVRSVASWEPSPEDVSAALDKLATGAGHAFGWFRQALEGVAQPTQTVQPASLTAIAAASCCSTSNDPRVLTASTTAGTSGIDIAARAVVAAGESGEVAAELVAVAGAESGFRADADNASSSAHGWWQILTRTHGITDAQAADPYFAARFAVQLRDASPNGLAGPWAETYGKGLHRPYLEDARAAVARQGRSEIPNVGNVTDSVTRTDALGRCSRATVDTTTAGPGEEDLAPNAIPARRAVLAAFGPMTIGGWGTRPNATEHDDLDDAGRKASNALDFMTSDKAKGDAIAAFLLEHAAELHVDYLIWDRRIVRPGQSWRPYNGRSPHTDHVHLSVIPEGRTA